MNGFYIGITNKLLEPKHVKKMGSAVWEFMWCIDKITKVDENEIGWVLGGKPIKLSEIKKDIGKANQHLSGNLTKLKNAGYINTKRTPYGLIISVNKAKKRFNQKVKSRNDPKVKSHNQKVKSNIRQDSKTKQLTSSYEEVREPGYGNEDINYLVDYLKELTALKKLDGSVRQNRRYCWLCVSKFGGREGVENLVQMAVSSNFHAKNLTSFKYLFYHAVKIANEFRYQTKNPKIAKIS